MSNWLDRGGFEGWTTSIHPAKPCVLCGIESVIEMDTMPIHPPCWMRSTRQERADRQVRLRSDDGWVTLAKPYPPCVVCGTVASQAIAGIPMHRGDCEDVYASRNRPVAPPTPPAPRGSVVAEGPRFLADSAVVDVTGSWLSSGAAIAAPERAAHAGEIADWAISSRLGYGGNRHHRPEPGHVWLTMAMCARLDLPTGPFDAETEAEQALATMRQTPFFTQAETAGWQILTDASQPWVRLRRDKHTVIITGIGWGSGRYDELLHGDPDPRALAGRLGYLCTLIGYPYTITPPMTGVHSLAYSTTHGLPPVTLPQVMFNDVGANPSWIDLEQLADLSAAHPDWWAHKYDRRASYAASAGSAILGTGPALHQPDGCAFDKRVAGLYRLAPLAAQPVPHLTGFDLRNPMGYPQVSGWMSRAAVQFLTEHGIEPDILEAYIWDPTNSGAQLKTWQATIRDARAALGKALRAGNPHAVAVSETALFKQLYTGAIGSLAATRGRQDPTEPAWRYYPHWRAEIVGTHTVNTLRAVARIAQRDDPQHRLPIAVGDTDAVVYIGASPDPGDVWPGQGDDALSNPALGKFKPAASIELGHWQQVMAAEQNKTKPRSQLQLIKAGKVWD